LNEKKNRPRKNNNLYSRIFELLSEYIRLKTIFLLLFFWSTLSINAQNQPNGFNSADEADYNVPRDSTKVKRIEIINTNQFEFKTTDSTTIRSFTGNVLFRHAGTNFYCNRALQYMNTEIVVASGKVHIEKPDSFDIWSDYLVYYSRDKLAKFRGNVIFKDKTAKLLTDSLDFDLNTSVGKFWGGGTFITDSSTLTSERGVYYHNTNEAFFYENVHLKNPKFDLYADSMRYNTEEQIAYFITATKIVSGKDVIYTNSGYYNTKTNTAKFDGRTQMTSGTSTIEADTLYYDKAAGYGEAIGNVIWEDTTEQIVIVAHYAEYKDSLSYVLATGDPLLIDVNEDDTTYMSADTLVTFKLPRYMAELEDDSLIVKDSLPTNLLPTDTIVAVDSLNIIAQETPVNSVILKDTIFTNLLFDTLLIVQDSSILKDSIRIFYAYYDAKILQGRMSGICDSFYYSTKDSIFRMHQQPTVWMDTTEFSGETILMEIKNKNVNRIVITQNAFIAHENGPDVYDQTSGKEIIGYLENNKLVRMEILGNGESIYFIKDDSAAFVGGNQSVCSKMDIFMDTVKEEVNNILFVSKPEATFTPFELVNLASFRLPGFKWQFVLKPKKASDIARDAGLYKMYLNHIGIETFNIEEEKPPKEPLPDEMLQKEEIIDEKGPAQVPIQLREKRNTKEGDKTIQD
jgi:lipopolysaccharide export system protein LptA